MSKKENFLSEAISAAVKAVNKNLPKGVKVEESDLQWAEESKGDVTLPCFILAKKLKKSPIEIARDLSEKTRSAIQDWGTVRNDGAYLNFIFNRIKLAKSVLLQIQKEKLLYGATKTGKNKKIVIEYVSPNTNKPLHIGHLRNAFLGDSVINLLKNSGYSPISTILFNDRGIHICKSMLAYQKWGKGKKPNKKSDHFVGDFYVMFAQKVKKSKQLEKEAQALLQSWEKGDRKIVALWKKMNEWTFSGFDETFSKIGVSFNKEYLESNLAPKGRQIIEKAMKEKKLKKEKNGAIIADLHKFGLPNKVLVRGDGTSLYIVPDIALVKEKFIKFKPEKSIYVVASEQDLYFKQMFAVLEMLKMVPIKKNFHLSYGMVRLPEGKMKSREGTVVDADDLIEELEEMAEREIKKRDNKVSAKELVLRSEKIALAALKFHILLISPETDTLFDPSKSIDFKGKTGPYLLYTYARIHSIIKKAEIAPSKKVNFFELAILGRINLLLAKFPYICEEAAKEYDPSLLAKYLYDLADAVNKFYHEQSVIKAPVEKKRAFVLALLSVNSVLKKGLALLGIEVLEKM